ncbi:hypothetical protein ACOALA_20640 (plasmid) [Alicyclobacillus acidoterrestris]|uniref:hypothetical protein n=1 Tax=Alicyclobacillus acidoterrestris TaxID=1450 RepID=UPI003F53BA63
MPRSSGELSQKATIDYIKTTDVWDTLKASVKDGDEESAEMILRQIIQTMGNMKSNYEKVTVEVRKDLLKEVKYYCARNNYTLKTVMNVALETMLHIGMPEKYKEE